MVDGAKPSLPGIFLLGPVSLPIRFSVRLLMDPEDEEQEEGSQHTPVDTMRVCIIIYDYPIINRPGSLVV